MPAEDLRAQRTHGSSHVRGKRLGARTHAHATASLATDEAHASETPFSGHSWISVLVYTTWASLNHLPGNVRKARHDYREYVVICLLYTSDAADE